MPYFECALLAMVIKDLFDFFLNEKLFWHQKNLVPLQFKLIWSYFTVTFKVNREVGQQYQWEKHSVMTRVLQTKEEANKQRKLIWG